MSKFTLQFLHEKPTKQTSRTLGIIQCETAAKSVIAVSLTPDAFLNPRHHPWFVTGAADVLNFTKAERSLNPRTSFQTFCLLLHGIHGAPGNAVAEKGLQ